MTKGNVKMKKITIICDRCGKEFAYNNFSDKRTITLCRLQDNFRGLGESYDLCKECFDELYGWWNKDSAVFSYNDVNKLVGHLSCEEEESSNEHKDTEPGTDD